ncbi:MAG TPA: ABC transporter ATP-binding protein [Longimicrobiaceae bacterium]|nr:ABC transporter ATP-binding protein [Longimicrobiaceae bacterium]
MKKQHRREVSPAWREARALMWRHRRPLALGFALMVLGRGAGLVLPASPKWLVDEVVGKGRHELLVPLVLAIAAATGVQAAASLALLRVVGTAAQRAIAEMRLRVQERVVRFPARYFASTQSGALISRIMTDTEGMRNLIGGGVLEFVGSLLTAVLAVGVLFYLHWQLTLVSLAVLVVFTGGMTYAFGRLHPLYRERGEITAQVTGRLAETLGGIQLVKAYGTEKREQRVFARGVHRLLRSIVRSIAAASATSAFATLALGVVGVLVVFLGGRALLGGRMTLGDLFTYVTFSALLVAPVMDIAGLTAQISEAFAGLDRIRELMQTPTEDDEDHGALPVPSLRGDLAFENVCFEYVAGVPVLRDVSFHAPAGTTTALVGSSGSGKSTLVSLVMAFNRPQRGRVLVDGHDLRELRLRDYRAQLGVVLQENFLFDGTVADNIRFARPDASREEIEEVARLANAEEFIRGFPQGYDTVVGERGIRLSGGQRQRIAIARALLADPRILILDEATSSLDSESEALIQEGLRRLRAGRTTFVIAHRLSTIRSAEQILVLEGGEVVERGTHAELMALGGRYRELHDRQYAWEHDLFVNPGEELHPETAVEEDEAGVAAG